MSGTNWKLAQEIYEEFLTCRICLDSFKSPKSLTCLHIFCEQCIESHLQGEASYKKYSDYRDFTCPICRKRTPVPTGGVKKLPDNFLIANLGEIIGRQRPTNPNQFPFCDICRTIQRKHREATSKCLDCNKLLCKSCVDTHRETKVTRNHSIFDVEIEKDVMCKEHKEEAVRFYCEPCETCICVLCTFADHRDHDVTDFSESAKRYQSIIKSLLEKCKGNLCFLEKQLEVVLRTEQQLKEAEQSIHDVAIEYISEIRMREKQMVEDLQRTYGKTAIDLIGNKCELQSQVEQLKTTCNLTDIVLAGKDIELLLLKKQLEEKLTMLAALQLCETPKGMHKEIKFVPGQLNLGILVDGDAAAATASLPNSPIDPLSMTPNRRKTCAGVFRYPPNTTGVASGSKPLTIDAATAPSISTQDAETMTDPLTIESLSIGTETEISTMLDKAVNTRARGIHSSSRAATSQSHQRRSENQSAYASAATEAQAEALNDETGGAATQDEVFENADDTCVQAEECSINDNSSQTHSYTYAPRIESPDSQVSYGDDAVGNTRIPSSSDDTSSSYGPSPVRRRERRRRAVIGPTNVEYVATISLDD